MSRITDMMDNIRIDLGDSTAQRYTDVILERHINRAISDFVIATKCLRERIYLELNSSSSIYDLRNYAIDFIRVEYLDKTILAKSYEELDIISDTWQSDTGEKVEYVTFDHLSKGMIRVYPIVTGSVDIITQPNLYGGLIDITIDESTYQIPSINDVEQNINQYLVCYIVKKPNTITKNTIDDDLELSIIYDKAIETYVTSLCLRSDTDAQNRSYANEQLQIYNNYVAECITEQSLDNNKLQDRVIKYRGAFDA